MTPQLKGAPSFTQSCSEVRQVGKPTESCILLRNWWPHNSQPVWNTSGRKSFSATWLHISTKQYRKFKAPVTNNERLIFSPMLSPNCYLLLSQSQLYNILLEYNVYTCSSVDIPILTTSIGNLRSPDSSKSNFLRAQSLHKQSYWLCSPCGA